MELSSYKKMQEVFQIMGKQKMRKLKTKTFKLKGIMQDINRKKKGSKKYKPEHTAFTIITRPINEDEMDELVFGGIYGHTVCLEITVTKEKLDEK